MGYSTDSLWLGVRMLTVLMCPYLTFSTNREIRERHNPAGHCPNGHWQGGAAPLLCIFASTGRIVLRVKRGQLLIPQP